MAASKNIRVSEEHREQLHGLKDVGESYDDVIGELLEVYRDHNHRELAEKAREVEAMDRDDLVPLDE